jgi:hypothetical protein
MQIWNFGAIVWSTYVYSSQWLPVVDSDGEHCMNFIMVIPQTSACFDLSFGVRYGITHLNNHSPSPKCCVAVFLRWIWIFCNLRPSKTIMGMFLFPFILFGSTSPVIISSSQLLILALASITKLVLQHLLYQPKTIEFTICSQPCILLCPNLLSSKPTRTIFEMILHAVTFLQHAL